jgi:peptidyl-prolyl cis-trans isomerase SurA
LRLLGGAFVALACLVQTAPAQTLFKPIAIVNDSAITGYDLAQRAQILVALGFPSASADSLRSAALEQLVEDRLKLQAGRQIGFNPNPDMIDVGISEFARRGGITVPEFRALMNTQGVTDQALEDMVTAEVIWSQVVQTRFGNRVQPGEAEVDAEIGLLQSRSGFSYRIREIGLPSSSDGRSEAETLALADRLSTALNAGGDFAAAVAEHSQAPSAARGGEVGWVTTDRMPPELIQALANLEVGQVSGPLTVAGGYSLIKLEEKRSGGSAPNSVDPQLRERVRQRLANQQSARLADGLLQEMRRDALIEIR